MSETASPAAPNARSNLELGAALVSGALFGGGLVVSGMADPRKVIGFLDVLGAWDPSLAFVMVGAIGVAFFGFRAARVRTLSGGPLALPRRSDISPSLILGSALFGAGWGLAGLCPGPSWVAVGAGHLDATLFIAAMLGGAALVDALRRRTASNPTVADETTGR